MSTAIRVLYVDDEPDLLEISKLFLEQTDGFSVTTIDSAPAALDLLKVEQFDAIVSDYQMPGMDGIQFLVEVRSRVGQVPFILFTGKGREEVVIQAINSGADFYLQKGGDPGAQFAELAHKVKQAALRNKAEDSLRKSEEKYRHLIEHSNEAIVVVQDGMLKLVNHKTIEFTGYSEQELLSMQFSGVIHPDDRSMVMERYQKRMRGEDPPSRYTFRLNSKDGNLRWVEIGAVVIDWDGRPATLNFLTDITERKRAEEKLLEAKARTATVLEGIADTFYSLDDKWRFTTVNPAAEKAPFGRPASELLGRVIWELYPGLVGTVIQQHYFDAAKNYSLEHYEGQSPLNGRWYEVFMHGRKGGVDVYMRDISERKQGEKTLAESEEKFRSLAESSRDYIMRYDRQCRHTYMNPAGLRVSGLSEDQLIGKTHRESGFEESLSRFWEEKITGVFETGKPFQTQFTWESAEGLVVLDWLLTPEFSDDGTVRSVMGVSRDVTQLKQAEQELVSAQERLKEAHHLAQIGTWDWVIETDTVTWSEELFRINGLDPGLPAPSYAELPKFYTPASWQVLSSAVENALTTGEPYNVELEVVRLDNVRRWTNAFGGLKYDANGKKTGLYGTVQDITWRKMAEEALHESEERYSSLFSNNYSVSLLIDPDTGRVVDANAAACRYYGYRSEQLIGKGLYEINRVDKEKIIRNLKEAKKKKEKHFFSTHFLAGGEQRNVEIYSGPILVSGKVLFYSIIHDVTDRVKTEEALRESEEVFREVFNKANDAIFLHELLPDGFPGHYFRVNDIACKRLGYSREELYKMSPKDIVSPQHSLNMPDIAAKLKSKGYGTFETVHQRKDGSTFPVEINTHIFTLQGRQVGLSIVRDITERKQVEVALQQSEARFRTIIHSMQFGVVIIDAKTHTILEANPKALEMIGCTSELVLDSVCHRFICPAESGRCPVTDLGQTVDSSERVLLTLRGEKIPILKSVIKAMLGGKEVLIESLIDITEHKLAEEYLVAELKRVQEQQAALALISFSPALLLGDVDEFSIKLTEESSGVLGVERASVWLFDNNGEELRCIDLYESSHNRHSRDLILNCYEYVNEFEAVRTAKYIDAHDPLTDPRTAGYVEGYLKPNHITSMLDAVIRVSGQNLGVLCFEHVDRPHHWETDEIAFACQLADQIAITLLNRDRKLAEIALQESEERYHNVVEDQTESICRFLPDGTHIFVNDAYCRYFDKKREEIIGHRFKPVLHPEDREIVARHIASITPEHPVIDIDQRIMMPDGSTRWQRWSDRAIFDQNGRVVEYQSVGRDITEQKELEKEMEYHAQELQRYSTSLATANKKLNLLSSITRHDINNQLTVLMGYLTLLEQKQPDPINTEYFLRVTNAAKRISAMIKFTKEYEEIGVNAPVWQDCRTLVDTAAKDAPLGMVVVKNDLPAGAEVFADPLVIKVFYNLMDNAVRYGGKITTIRFSIEESEGDHLIVCEDDGDGVVAGEKEKIFERGFGKNTGLGLALSREILSITGITITETGEPGKGARFEMAVPKGIWRMVRNGA